MDDLIKRQDAINAVHEVIISFFDDIIDGDTAPMTDNDKQLLSINRAITSKIKGLQSIEVKRGEWLKRKIKEHQFVQNGYELYYCSVCDKNYHDVSGFDFCPNCGADMRSSCKVNAKLR